jgi:putative DNA primase/helicase
VTTLNEARDQMLGAGMPEFPSKMPIADGKLHRYGSKSKAFYKLYEWVSPRTQVSYFSGFFGLWGVLDVQLIKVSTEGMDQVERARMMRGLAEAEERQRIKAADLAHRAANRALGQWRSASDAGPWPYLERKQVTPHRVRAFNEGTLLVPMYAYQEDGQVKLVGVQKISPAGEKRFTRGMAKKGSFCPTGAPLSGDAKPGLIVVCEGYATGRSIAMATQEKWPVVVAFDAGSLKPVGEVLRKQFPDAQLLFCADDDWQTEGNPGITSAHKAADALGAANGMAAVVRPLFADGRVEGWTDFNDVHVSRGLNEVYAQVTDAIMALSIPKLVQEVAADARELSAGASNVVQLVPAGPRPAPVSESPENGELVWQSRLTRTDRGAVKPTTSNISLILGNHPAWLGVIARNRFTEDVIKLRPPPYEGGEAGPWRDMDDVWVRIWLEQTYGFTPRKDDIVDAVMDLAERRGFHPVREYFSGLVWDGTPRVRALFSDYFGAQDNEYTRSVGLKFLVGAVARIFRPGCKLDNVLILEGRQGLQKSTALKVLAGDWFTDAPLKFNDKETYLLLQGQMIIELAELDSFSRSESSAAKLFFSMTESYYRPWYARRPVKVPRQCVFAGTVNNDNYLKDDTGNRRYWPVKCEAIEIAGLKQVRDQLWAEAVHEFDAGTHWWVNEDERPMFEEQQAARYVEDAYTSLIRKWYGTEDVQLEVKGPVFDGYETADFLGRAIKLDVGRWTRPEQQRVGHCLRELGWTRKRSSREGRPWVYWPPVPDRGSEPEKEAEADENQIPF